MRHVVFVAPFPAETSLRFLRALHGLSGLRVSVVANRLASGRDRLLYRHHARLKNPLNPSELRHAIASLIKLHGPAHRIVGLLEPMQVQLAQMREHFGVFGTKVATAELFRDKSKMKQALRRAGLPCAKHALLHSFSEARAFAQSVGLPIILKPPAGMGCKATWRIHRLEQLRSAIGALSPSAQNPVLAEEMLLGTEHSHETVTVHGQVQLSSVTDYHPTPLEVMENPWIQWRVVAPREVGGPAYADAHALGAKTIAALGLQHGMTHMEWFRRSDGSLAIGEIAARPPGANIVRLTGLCHSTSMYRAYARALVDDAFDGPFERRFASGCAFLRGSGQGRVLAVDGVGALRQRLGPIVVEAKLPRLGAPKSDSYEGDGYILVRHERTEVVEEALRAIVASIRVYYG
jgi:formate-dependent phosphoribosylglycinamide formyltransferase (GAR transformylase)